MSLIYPSPINFGTYFTFSGEFKDAPNKYHKYKRYFI